MIINKLLITLLTTAVALFSGCSSSAADPFKESAKRCEAWSSLSCQGVQLTLESPEGKVLTLREVLIRPNKKKFERIRYLNGWDESVTLDTEIPLSTEHKTWIAVNGYLPEEFSKYAETYSFAEDDCEQQITEGVDNGAQCTEMPEAAAFYFGGANVKGLLKYIGNKITLQEFIKFNNLPLNTSMSTKIVTSRYYKTGQR